jgi:hypothetical protein
VIVKIGETIKFEFNYGDTIMPLKSRADIIVAIDPGKTNMAVIVGTTLTEVLAILQFSGAGSKIETEEYCRDVKYFLKQYLSQVKVVKVGMEESVTYKGMQYHKSSLVLTHIRGALIDLFFELFNIKVEKVNNWTWKSAILPQGYRSQSEKGSTRYLENLYKQYGNSDVTDAVCIYLYLLENMGEISMICCDNKEFFDQEYSMGFYDAKIADSDILQKFIYNYDYSLVDNLNYYLNRTSRPGVASVIIEQIDKEVFDNYNIAADVNSKIVGLVVAKK